MGTEVEGYRIVRLENVPLRDLHRVADQNTVESQQEDLGILADGWSGPE